jgi:hypothetical protein
VTDALKTSEKSSSIDCIRVWKIFFNFDFPENTPAGYTDKNERGCENVP